MQIIRYVKLNRMRRMRLEAELWQGGSSGLCFLKKRIGTHARRLGLDFVDSTTCWIGKVATYEIARIGVKKCHLRKCFIDNMLRSWRVHYLLVVSH